MVFVLRPVLDDDWQDVCERWIVPLFPRYATPLEMPDWQNVLQALQENRLFWIDWDEKEIGLFYIEHVDQVFWPHLLVHPRMLRLFSSHYGWEWLLATCQKRGWIPLHVFLMRSQQSLRKQLEHLGFHSQPGVSGYLLTS